MIDLLTVFGTSGCTPWSLTPSRASHEAAEQGMHFVVGRSLDDYRADVRLKSAEERRFAMIGEALARALRAFPDVAPRGGASGVTASTTSTRSTALRISRHQFTTPRQLLPPTSANPSGASTCSLPRSCPSTLDRRKRHRRSTPSSVPHHKT